MEGTPDDSLRDSDSPSPVSNPAFSPTTETRIEAIQETMAG